MTTIPERFWQQVDQTSAAPCWLWTGPLDKAGYGARVQHNHERDYPHRWFYRVFVGLIPKHLEINHRCRVRNCVNPEHLEVVTHLRNQRDLRKERCHRGHPMAGDNLYLHETGKRECRACNRERGRAFRHRRQKNAGALELNVRYVNQWLRSGACPSKEV